MESKLVADIMVKILLCLYFFLFVYFKSWCGVKPIYNIILTVFTCETNKKTNKKHLLLLKRNVKNSKSCTNHRFDI